MLIKTYGGPVPPFKFKCGIFKIHCLDSKHIADDGRFANLTNAISVFCRQDDRHHDERIN